MFSRSLLEPGCRADNLGDTSHWVSLMEAHEKAVINGADRRYFTELVEQALYDRDMPVQTSEKALSKRLRWL